MYKEHKGNVDIRHHKSVFLCSQTMGCLALAGFIHMLTGMFGLVGFVMKFVGPITVIPTVLLIGLNAFKVTTKFCQVHWGIAAV